MKRTNSLEHTLQESLEEPEVHREHGSCGHSHEDDGQCEDSHGHHAHDHSDSHGCEHEHHHDEHCGCGHEHHHDEHCDCGHEHHHDEHCGCGHEHHHDEHCGCGHEHHHDDEHCDCGHEHHHDEHCGCGHEHHHDEHCGCGHEHHHENTTADTAEAPLAPGMHRGIYILENLGCAHCAAKMEAQIQALPGIQTATITFATKQLRLTAKDPDKYLPQIRQICTSIESEVRIHKRETSASAEKDHRESSDKKDIAELVSGAALFVLSEVLGHMGASDSIVLTVCIVAYVILGRAVVLTAVRNLSRGQLFDENFLMSIATIGAFFIRSFDEAVGVMLFYRIGEFFEHKAVERSRSQIMEAVDLRPETVNLLSPQGDITVLPSEKAQVGDVLLVRAGDRIPLDGIVLDGQSRIDTSAITGEPVPVKVSAGDAITSGCVNTTGQLKIRVEKPLSESMVTRILDSVENAAASKPKIDRFITQFARIYTPIVVLLALATAVIPSLVSGNWNYWIYTALTFLVMSCPCALVLSVPLAFFSGIGAGSKKGILFKGGVSLEAMSGVHAVVMDKTGTVTEGNFVVQNITLTHNLPENELLAYCASCEQFSTHPIAVSIHLAATERGLSLKKPESMEEIAGHGIHAQIDGHQILCGNPKLMDRFHVDLGKYQESSYGSQVLVAVDGVLAGYFSVADTVKGDAKSAVANMKKMGIHTAMLTGDGKANAAAVANELEIDSFYARLLPQDKLNRLGSLRKKYGSVMFVGDGINDAPVLAASDVGAAMGSGADAAIEAADVVYMTPSVEAIPQSIRIAKAAKAIAWQNVIFALTVKVLVMILGLLSFASMWAAVFADTGVAMLCVLNSIRILYRKND